MGLRRARYAKRIPIVFLQQRAIADRQPRHQAKRGVARQPGFELVRDALARLQQPVAEMVAADLGRADAGGGADTLLEQPLLVIVPAGIERAVRRAHAQVEAPAVAAAHGRRAVRPGHADQARQPAVGRREQEAEVVPRRLRRRIRVSLLVRRRGQALLRQAGDAARHLDLLVAARQRPARVPQALRMPGSEQKAQRGAGVKRAPAPGQQGRHGQRRQPDQRRQCRQAQQRQRASGEQQNSRQQRLVPRRRG